MSHNKSEDESGDERDMNTIEINEIDDKVGESFEESVGNTTEKDGERSGSTDRLDDKNVEHSDQSDSSLELRDHLGNLPQELYDRIYDLTFTAAPKSLIYASRAFIRKYHLDTGGYDHVASINEKLPHLMHVDRRSREKFAKSYFGGPGSFVAIYTLFARNVCIEDRHFRWVDELALIRDRTRFGHAYAQELRQEMVNRLATVGVQNLEIEILSASQLVDRCDDLVVGAIGT